MSEISVEFSNCQLNLYIVKLYRITGDKKHSVRHYKDKFIKISQKIYFVYLFFRVSGTNVL